MANLLTGQVINKLDAAARLYYRLIIVAGYVNEEKMAAFRNVQKYTGAPLINVNLELSRTMLELTERQRVLQLPQLLGDLIKEAYSDVVLLDNMEILFEVSLRQDPLRLLQGLSRNKTIIVSWNGNVENDYLMYAVPEHPEFKRYKIADLLVVVD